VDGRSDRLQGVLVVSIESLRLGGLDAFDGLQEERPAVGEPVETSEALPQLGGRLPVAADLQSGQERADRMEELIVRSK